MREPSTRPSPLADVTRLVLRLAATAFGGLAVAVGLVSLVGLIRFRINPT
jgi:hypothetical protein